MTPKAEAAAFLKLAEAYQLGGLETERPHPLSGNLSTLAKEHLTEGLRTLREIDRLALERLGAALGPGEALAIAVRETFAAGGRVYLAGCGATGRLSLALETLARQGMLPSDVSDRVVAFMAGGDAALIRSIEGFEDLPEYGARQLAELGYGAGDLLIASTEGGETPWVIGVTEAALKVGGAAPWFCYGNPDDLLTVERSQRVLQDECIEKWNLSVGPMALAGSTRMQSSTVLMLGIGLAMLAAVRPEAGTVAQRFDRFCRVFDQLPWDDLAPLTEAEATAYAQGERLVYCTTAFGLSVLTDTTERSPTFSLAPFENALESAPEPGLCALELAGSKDTPTAWRNLLGREPRCLEWEECQQFTGLKWLNGYTLSRTGPGREGRLPFWVDADPECGAVMLAFKEESWAYPDAGSVACDAAEQRLFDNMMLKMVLNAHSTLVMGRLGRYEGNLMTYVKAANLKLIDRAVRYVRILHERKTGRAPAYSVTCRALFRAKAKLKVGEPIVLKALDLLSR